MKQKTVGIALLSFIILGVLIGGWFIIGKKIDERKMRQASDSRITEKLIIAGDNYLGYFFIDSPEMKKQASYQGLGIEFVNDKGDYARRLSKFANGTYDGIVLPVNSYLYHGNKHKFPGVIVAAVSESKGADGIVAFADRLGGTDIKNLNRKDLKVVFTADSPSSFLLDLTISDFDLFNLQSSPQSRVEVLSSEEVYEKAKKNEGDVFVLWEPDLSKALALNGIKSIWSSEQFRGYIIDVFVFRREVLDKRKDALEHFFQSYFRTMQIYANNREQMLDDMATWAKIKKDDVKTILPKIDWYDSEENAGLMFGIAKPGEHGQEGIVNSIVACTDKLLTSKRLAKDPLEGDPYRITNKSIIETLQKGQVNSKNSAQVPIPTFGTLSDNEWHSLREIGALRVEPITFQIGSIMLDDNGKNASDKITQMLINNYPTYRVVIRGHTGPADDEKANIQLSLERAEAVKQRLLAVHAIDPNRVHVEGVGSSMPPQLRPGESPRNLEYRKPRVEFILYAANNL